MTINEIMQPFVVFFNWLRTYEIVLGEFTFTFMDLFVWLMLGSILIGFFVRLLNE